MKKQYTIKDVVKLTPAAVDKMTPEEVLAAYNDLRGPVNKRLQALERAGYMKRHPKYSPPTTTAVTKIAKDIGQVTPGSTETSGATASQPGVTNIEQPGVSDVEKLVMKTGLREKVLDLAKFVRTGPSATKSQKRRQATIQAMMDHYGYSKAKATAMQNFFDKLREQTSEDGHVAGSDEIMDFWEDMLEMKAKTSVMSKHTQLIDEAFTLWKQHDYEFGEIARGDIKLLEDRLESGNGNEYDENALKALKDLRKEMNKIIKKSDADATTGVKGVIKRTKRKIKKKIKRK